MSIYLTIAKGFLSPKVPKIHRSFFCCLAVIYVFLFKNNPKNLDQSRLLWRGKLNKYNSPVILKIILSSSVQSITDSQTVQNLTRLLILVIPIWSGRPVSVFMVLQGSADNLEKIPFFHLGVGNEARFSE